jgi:hypothetical protein
VKGSKEIGKEKWIELVLNARLLIVYSFLAIIYLLARRSLECNVDFEKLGQATCLGTK